MALKSTNITYNKILRVILVVVSMLSLIILLITLANELDSYANLEIATSIALIIYGVIYFIIAGKSKKILAQYFAEEKSMTIEVLTSELNLSEDKVRKLLAYSTLGSRKFDDYMTKHRISLFYY